MLKNICIDAVIFDLDGTLWDASKSCAKAWNEVLDNYGYNHKLSVHDARSLSGIKLEIMFPQFFPFVPKSKYDDMMRSYGEREAYFIKKIGGKLYPSVLNLLRYLKENTKLFIVSNCIDGYIETFINNNKLYDFFSDYESAGKTGLDKKENLKLLIERNSLINPVYVGDTKNDYEAAMNNNIPFIYASYGFGSIPNFRYKIDNFTDLINVINLVNKETCL